jgi:hypothetical protein
MIAVSPTRCARSRGDCGAGDRGGTELAAQDSRIFERRQNLLRILRTAIGILLEAPHDERRERRRNFRSELAKRRRLLGQMRREQRVRRAVVERILPANASYAVTPNA